MPIIKRIKGLVIRMFYRDHPPPHFHASNSERNGLFEIESLDMFKGNLSQKEQNIVKQWAQNLKDRLMNMWNSQKITKIE